MKRKQAKELLLSDLKKNPDLSKKGMFIFGFTKDGIVKKFCTIEKCIAEVENETPHGKQMIDLTRKLTTLKVY
jgi:hypothetical protein